MLPLPSRDSNEGRVVILKLIATRSWLPGQRFDKRVFRFFIVLGHLVGHQVATKQAGVQPLDPRETVAITARLVANLALGTKLLLLGIVSHSGGQAVFNVHACHARMFQVESLTA
jgi:hypothetical protein